MRPGTLAALALIAASPGLLGAAADPQTRTAPAPAESPPAVTTPETPGRVEGLGPRPAAFTDGGDGSYAETLYTAVAALEGLAAGPKCARSSYRSAGFTEFAPGRAPPHWNWAEAPAAIIEHVRVEGCGRRIQRNVAVRAGPPWRTEPLRAGASRTDPALQHEAALVANEIVRAHRGTRIRCEDPRVGLPVQLLRAPDARGAWTERWPLSLCDGDRSVDVRFEPAADGSIPFTVTARWGGPPEVRRGPEPSRITKSATGEELARYFPAAALETETEGQSVIECRLLVTGALADCRVLEEKPEGFGFGEAHVRAAELFRMRPDTWNGRPVETWVRFPFAWRLG